MERLTTRHSGVADLMIEEEHCGDKNWLFKDMRTENSQNFIRAM